MGRGMNFQGIVGLACVLLLLVAMIWMVGQ